MTDAAVPDADRYEQDLLLTAPLTDVTPTIDVEVPEADAIEQALPGPVFDEDDAPR